MKLLALMLIKHKLAKRKVEGNQNKLFKLRVPEITERLRQRGRLAGWGFVFGIVCNNGMEDGPFVSHPDS